MAKAISLSSRSIKYKLIVAVCLMSVIPFLVCLNIIFPSLLSHLLPESMLPILFLIMPGMIILGFIIIKQILDSVVKLSRDALLIAEGNLEKPIDTQGEDEVGQLGQALNQLTVKIKKSMDELKDYGSKTAQINIEIQKRVFFMSALLQISDLIVQGEKLDAILHICLEKVKDLAHSSVSFILFFEGGEFIPRVQFGLSQEAEAKAVFSEHNECLRQIFAKGALTVIDAKNQKPFCQRFVSVFGLRNFLGFPIASRQKPIALLGIGNDNLDFTYNDEDIELFSIFGKQMGIAIENYLLLERLEKLEIKDALTGLYNQQYIHHRLDEEIKRAILAQRPCSFILARIHSFEGYQKLHGPIAAETVFKKMASYLSGAFSGIECVGRFGDYQFAIILPERNKRQAEKLAEELKSKMEYLFRDEPREDKKLHMEIAVAENPLDGVNARELILFAQNCLL